MSTIRSVFGILSFLCAPSRQPTNRGACDGTWKCCRSPAIHRSWFVLQRSVANMSCFFSVFQFVFIWYRYLCRSYSFIHVNRFLSLSTVCFMMCSTSCPMILMQDNLLEWHFVLHALPEDTPYSKGCYHGKVLFPAEYPHAPPAILMMTPSGRLETGKRLCLSMTDFHPESWNPAWSVETILVGLLSFFISDEKGYGSVRNSEEQRKLLAEKSWESNAGSAVFRSLFPEFLHIPETSETSQNVGDPSPIVVPAEAQVSHESFEVAPEALEEGVVPVVPVSEHRSERSNSSSECWICRDVTDESF